MHFKVPLTALIHDGRGDGPSGRGEIVAYYRLYVLSGPSGRFVGFEEFEAADDVEALRRADGFIGDQPLELWCGSRKVRSIPAAAART